jgi:hypothetical protein
MGSMYIHMWRVFQKSSNVLGLDTTLGQSSKPNTLLRVHSWKPGQKEICKMAQCLCCIPYECGRSCIRETSRPLAVWLHEHRHNLQQGLLEELKLAQHAYEEGHRVGLDGARILEIESKSRYRKYKESAHMACLTNPINQRSLETSPIWIPLISNEVFN